MRAPVLIASDTLEGHLANAQAIASLARQQGEPLELDALAAIAQRIVWALLCLEEEGHRGVFPAPGGVLGVSPLPILEALELVPCVVCGVVMRAGDVCMVCDPRPTCG